MKIIGVLALTFVSLREKTHGVSVVAEHVMSVKNGKK